MKPDDGEVVIGKEVLTEEHKQKILSKKLNFSNLADEHQPPSEVKKNNFMEFITAEETDNQNSGFGGIADSLIIPHSEIVFEKVDEKNLQTFIEANSDSKLVSFPTIQEKATYSKPVTTK